MKITEHDSRGLMAFGGVVADPFGPTRLSSVGLSKAWWDLAKLSMGPNESQSHHSRPASSVGVTLQVERF